MIKDYFNAWIIEKYNKLINQVESRLIEINKIKKKQQQQQRIENIIIKPEIFNY